MLLNKKQKNIIRNFISFYIAVLQDVVNLHIKKSFKINKSENKKLIVFIADKVLPRVQKIAKALKNQGYEVVILTKSISEQEKESFSSYYLYKSVYGANYFTKKNKK